MKKFVALVCEKCGRKDVSDDSVVPHYVGTSIDMICDDCGWHNTRFNRYAKFCRKCCPTGHGTI